MVLERVWLCDLERGVTVSVEWVVEEPLVEPESFLLCSRSTGGEANESLDVEGGKLLLLLE